MDMEIGMPLKKLKICFVAGTLGVGGAEGQLFFIIRALQKLGADITLICLHSGEFWEQRIKDLGISYYTLNGKGNKLTRIFEIIGILLKVKPAYVQSQHFYTNLYAVLGAMFCGAKSIGASRNEIKIEMIDNGIFGNASFKLPKYLIANSYQSVEQAIALGKNKQKVFYLSNAIDTSRFSKDPDDKITKDKTILMGMGRLHEQKRFDKFISLIARLKEKYGNDRIKGLIIGSGEREQELRGLAAGLDLNNNDLEFVLHTATPERYMNQSDIFVLTSDFEGTPNVVLEAMASSMPVIMTNVGNLQYFVKDGENGLFFNGSDEDLFEIAVSLIENEQMAGQLSRNARKTMEDLFSLEALDKNLIYIYDTIIRD
jgi:glycosyltransferase involved in cell wall biosynthesis